MAMLKWISAKETLPSQSTVRSHWPTSTYDVCDAPYDEVFVTTAQYDSEQKIWHLVVWDEQINALLDDESAPANGNIVTHWMPLPEAPRADDEYIECELYYPAPDWHFPSARAQYGYGPSPTANGASAGMGEVRRD